MLDLEFDYQKFIGIMLLVIVIVVWFYIHVVERKRNKKKSTFDYLKKGDSKSAEGVIFGKYKGKLVYSSSEEEGHILVTGGSGSGKTSSVLIPTLRAFSGTFFCVDISGDIYSNVKRQQQLLYSPENPQSVPYNIFGNIDSLRDVYSKNESLEQLAYLMMPESLEMSDSSRYFVNEGRKILTASLIAFYHKGYDFVEICKIIYVNSWRKLFSMIDESDNEYAISYINSFEGTNEQNTAGCKQQADAAVKLFATSKAMENTVRRPKKNENSFYPEQLERYNVFINIPDGKLTYYAALLHVITAQSLEYFSNRPSENKNKILFCLDEFASLGKLDIIHALQTLRKKHIRIMVLSQSFSDIDMIYGKNERIAMMNNFKFKMILEAGDPDTQDYFSRLIGQKLVFRNSITRSSGKVSNTKSQQKDWIIEPVDFSHLDKELILIYPGGYIRLEKNYWFKNL